MDLRTMFVARFDEASVRDAATGCSFLRRHAAIGAQQQQCSAATRQMHAASG